MPDDDELDDPGKTENRGWPAPGGPGAGKSGDDALLERLREAQERVRREQERRDRDEG